MELLGPNFANSTPLTPLGFLERTATVHGNLPSVVYNKTVYTWSETHLRCLRLASALSSIGVAPGHVVSVMAPNIPAMYEMQFAVPMSGAILNNINLRLDARTISVLLQHSNAKVLFVDTLSHSLALDAIDLFPDIHKPPELILIEDPYHEGSSTHPTSPTTYEQMIEFGDPNFGWIRPKSEWSPMVLNYTSGTTSSPKGVVHSHRGLFLMTNDSIIDWSLPENPTYLWTLPMFHANGWSYPWGVCAKGGTNVCLRGFDAPAVYESIREHGVTHLCAAPVVLNMLANAPGSRSLPEHGVHVLTAGSPPPAPVLGRAERLGFRISHGYGLTETAGLAVMGGWKREWDGLPDGERARLKARQGVRTNGMAEVDVVDGEGGRSVERDGETMGEIVLRGGCVMLGYLKDEEGTRKAIREDGWFYTGDVGVMHPDGYIEIRDRSKDIIISGGENLSSVEVESILYSHPAVNEAAVVARADEYWGESPCAFISLKDGQAVNEKEIIAWCRKNMPRYMVPKTVIFKQDLPKTSTGKIQKYILRNLTKELGSVSSVPNEKTGIKSAITENSGINSA